MTAIKELGFEMYRRMLCIRWFEEAALELRQGDPQRMVSMKAKREVDKRF